MKFDFWTWNNVFPQNEVKKLNKFIEKNLDKKETQEHGARDIAGHNHKQLKTSWIFYHKLEHHLKDVIPNALSVNHHYFGFDLYPLLKNDYLNYNIYDPVKEDNYDWHIDGSKSDVYDLKLTILINLSEKKYKGGEFLIFNQCPFIVDSFSKAGDVIMFPSFLNHKVNPVKNNERRSLSIFLKGPKFK